MFSILWQTLQFFDWWLKLCVSRSVCSDSCRCCYKEGRVCIDLPLQVWEGTWDWFFFSKTVTAEEHVKYWSPAITKISIQLFCSLLDSELLHLSHDITLSTIMLTRAFLVAVSCSGSENYINMEPNSNKMFHDNCFLQFLRYFIPFFCIFLCFHL